MANRRISDLPAITSVDIDDADLLTVVHVSEVDPGLKNKKFTFTEHKNYLNNYYLQLTGGTVTNLTVANNLNVSGNTVLRGNLNVLATGIFNAILISDLTVTGVISGNTITGQNILTSNINANSGVFNFIDVSTNATFNSGTFAAISGNTITGNSIRASGITGQVITGDSVSAQTFNAATITGTTSVISPLISGTIVTGDTGRFSSITGVSGVFTTQLSGATITGNTALFSTQTVGTGNFTRVSGATITGTTGLFSYTSTNSGQFVTVSGAVITGDSALVNVGKFNRITGGFYVANNTTFVTGEGDVRPFDQFSFPASPGSSGYVLTTLGNGQTAWAIATTTGVVTNGPIAETKILITFNYAIASGYNGLSVGPVGIESGVTVTIPSGSTWKVLD